MEHLPPVGWADVATKRDLDGVRRDLDGVRRELELKIDATVHREVRTAVLANFVGNGLLAAVVLAAAQLL